MSKPQKVQKKARRKYSEKTLKILFAMSRNKCAFPGCSRPIIQPKTDYSEAAVIGQIAHIYAASGDGPRGNSSMTAKDLDRPDNLILLCPNCHAVVDKQHETYTAETLLKWKEKQLREYQEELRGSINDLGAAELEIAARALMTTTSDHHDNRLTRIPPEEKIRKNGLGTTSSMFLKMGAAKSFDVENVLLRAAQLDSEFPVRLRDGFVKQYLKFKADGRNGDDLFLEMYNWAGGGTVIRHVKRPGFVF